MGRQAGPQLRSWISGPDLADSAAWVPAGRGERDPQQFWLSVLAALGQTVPGSALVRELTAAPDLDGWAITEQLLTDLAPLDDQVWLVIDDVHELGPDALRQLELLILRARRVCFSCWPPGMTCRWGCTGCGWRASWPRSASRICGSPWPRSCSCPAGGRVLRDPADRGRVPAGRGAGPAGRQSAAAAAAHLHPGAGQRRAGWPADRR